MPVTCCETVSCSACGRWCFVVVAKTSLAECGGPASSPQRGSRAEPGNGIRRTHACGSGTQQARVCWMADRPDHLDANYRRARQLADLGS